MILIFPEILYLSVQFCSISMIITASLSISLIFDIEQNYLRCSTVPTFHFESLNVIITKRTVIIILLCIYYLAGVMFTSKKKVVRSRSRISSGPTFDRFR